MRKARIVQLIGCLKKSGAERVVVDLAKGLKSVNYEVTVCSREGGSLIPELNGVPTIILPKRGLIDSKHLLGLCEILRREKIDLIHTHLFGNNLYGFFASILTGKKIIFTVHGEDCLKSKRRLVFYRLAGPFVSKIVTVSGFLYEKVRKEVGISEGKLAVIANGINTEQFRNERVDTFDKRGLGLPGDGLVVGTIGTMKPVKGQDILIKAAAEVIRQVPEACFAIVGRPSQYHREYEEYLFRLRRDYGLENQVYFLGERDNVEAILPLFEVFVLPSRSEGTSIALLEAMASGRAIVATNVGGNPHLIHDKKTGLLVPPEDPGCLAEAIITLLRNRSFARRLAENAQRAAEKEYRVESMVERYAALYDEVLS